MGEREIRSIVVFRALKLGDMLCAVPALRALRLHFPAANILLAGLRAQAGFAARFRRYLDGMIDFPGYPGLPEARPAMAEIPRFFDYVRSRRFDLALQMHGNGKITNDIVALFGAQRAVGFCAQGGQGADASRFVPVAESEHEIKRCLRLAALAGARPSGEDLEFPLFARDHEDFRKLPAAGTLVAGKFVCLHPGASMASRRWHPERFAAVGDMLAERGFAVVITGSNGETELARSVAALMKRPGIVVAGRTSVGSLAVLVGKAALVISNDTSVSHIAAALCVPSVIIACGSDPRRWAPLDKALHTAVYAPVPCRPCHYDACPCGHACAERVSAGAVSGAALRLVGRRNGRAKGEFTCAH